MRRLRFGTRPKRLSDKLGTTRLGKWSLSRPNHPISKKVTRLRYRFIECRIKVPDSRVRGTCDAGLGALGSVAERVSWHQDDLPVGGPKGGR